MRPKIPPPPLFGFCFGCFFTMNTPPLPPREMRRSPSQKAVDNVPLGLGSGTVTPLMENSVNSTVNWLFFFEPSMTSTLPFTRIVTGGRFQPNVSRTTVDVGSGAGMKEGKK